MGRPEQSHSESRQTQKKRRLKTYLREHTRDGDQYFKSKYIARDLGLSPKEVGALLVKLRESSTTVAIEKWSQTTPTTWRVGRSRPDTDITAKPVNDR